MRMIVFRFACLVMLTASILAFCLAPSLAEAEPTPNPHLAELTPEESSSLWFIYEDRNPEILQLKETLYEYGYYNMEIYGLDTLRDDSFDAGMLNALHKFCETNDMMDMYSPRGIWTDVYYALIDKAIDGKPIVNLNAEAPAESAYQHIGWNEESPAVGQIQQRLRALNYPGVFTTNLYDEELRKAIDLFVEANGLNYDQGPEGANGIDPALQAIIMESESVVPYVEPEPSVEPTPEPTAAPSGIDKVRHYLMDNSSVLGINMPNLALWLIGIVLVVLVVLAFIHFFVSPGSDAAGADAQHTTNRQKKGGKVLNFAITYQGQKKDYSCTIGKALHIGRNVGSFPLNMEDGNISRRHCELYYQNNRLMLKDYSSNGTKVNDREVHNSTAVINSGDKIIVGDHEIVITFTGK